MLHQEMTFLLALSFAAMDMQVVNMQVGDVH